MPARSAARRPTPGRGYNADIAPVAALMADPARAAMLGALLERPAARRRGTRSDRRGQSRDRERSSRPAARRRPGGGHAAGQAPVLPAGRARGRDGAGGRWPRSARRGRSGACGSRGRRPRSRRPGPATTTWPGAPGWRCSTRSSRGGPGRERHRPCRLAYEVTGPRRGRSGVTSAVRRDRGQAVPAPLRRGLPGLDPAPPAPERRPRRGGHRPAARARRGSSGGRPGAPCGSPNRAGTASPRRSAVGWSPPAD